jgi:predicted ATP-dependent protease
MEWTAESEAQYAGALICAAGTLNRPLDREAVATLIEESARVAEDQHKLSLRVGQMADLIREAEQLAGRENAPAVGAAHVRRAVEQRRYRSSLIPERLREAPSRGGRVIRPEGEAVGQVHGLSVSGIGDTLFGRPTRITATAGLGREGVLDIERQAELGGKIHSKGVLILGGYLADTYTRDKPLVLSARLVFEQSYGEVEGDSASLAELLALLSRLADAPLRQGIAVTGSVNQRGEVQAVGGVNAKIEGFFDTCVAAGLSGDQGVILPAANVQHLMLREDVVAAAAAGRFHVYAAETVDQALEILTGQPAGTRGDDGRFAPESIHARADARLRAFAETLQAFGAAEPGRNGAPSPSRRQKPRKA